MHQLENQTWKIEIPMVRPVLKERNIVTSSIFQHAMFDCQSGNLEIQGHTSIRSC